VANCDGKGFCKFKKQRRAIKIEEVEFEEITEFQNYGNKVLPQSRKDSKSHKVMNICFLVNPRVLAPSW